MNKPDSRFYTVLPTGSMKPMFDDKAVLLLETVPFRELRVDGIVTYRHPKLGVPVVHRLIRKDGDRFLVKGDVNSNIDNLYVTAQNYLQRVYGVLYTDGR